MSWRLILFLWLGVLLVQLLLPVFAKHNEIAYSQFKKQLNADNIQEVAISKDAVHGKFDQPVNGKNEFTAVRVDDPKLVPELEDKGVRTTGVESSSFWDSMLVWLIPIGLVLLVFGWLRRRAGGGSPLGLTTFGRSRAKLHLEKDVDVAFSDVAGVEEAKEELTEVVEFLRTPGRFERLGGKLPKGILLVGPPGTGKTLLAKAVAGEAGVPFFSISGSEFVEMFVGVGAARVRDLFTQAKQRAPCIVFIDELDALGKARGMGPMAHEEREQTLNQLLVELDGFDPHVGVVLMAATNRPEILDPALLRAGRFDRQVLVDRPDKPDRLAILKLHARSIKLSPQANLDEIASMTAGFAGADLANIVNEAALLAVRARKSSVDTDDLREAVERVVAGLEKKNRVLTPGEKERVAHHELGHALVALMLPGTDPVQKISIIPRGVAALGYTLQLPTEDRFLMTRQELENRVAVLLGGRAAEELVYGEISTGAQDDLRKATDIARSMVENFGMSERLGEVSLQRQPAEPFMGGRSERRPGEYSDVTAREIDCEIRDIIDRQHRRSQELLRRVEPVLRQAAVRLIERETIVADELREIAGDLLPPLRPARRTPASDDDRAPGEGAADRSHAGPAGAEASEDDEAPVPGGAANGRHPAGEHWAES